MDQHLDRTDTLQPGDWVIELGSDGGGRYGQVRDPAYSPTGRVRIDCYGAKLRDGRWTFDPEPAHRSLDPSFCDRATPEEAVIIQAFFAGEVAE